MDKDIENFCRKYDAVVGPSGKIRHRVKRMPVPSLADLDPMQLYTIPYEETPCVEIHMTEDSFRALVEHQSWLINTGREDINTRMYAQHIVDRHQAETFLRRQHPGLQDLWEQYQTMLNLIK